MLMVLLNVGFPDDGLKETVTPEGCPVDDSATACAEDPASRSTETVVCAEEPLAMDRLEGLTDRA